MHLQDAQMQRETAARDFEPSIGYVLDWLKDHEHEFEHPVCRPPMISVNLTDTRLAKQIEGATNPGQRKVGLHDSEGVRR
jgi:hypothetical protein